MKPERNSIVFFLFFQENSNFKGQDFSKVIYFHAMLINREKKWKNK